MKPDLEILPGRFAIAKVRDFDGVRFVPFTFLARTDAEWSVVCREEEAPENALAKETGFGMLRIQRCAGPSGNWDFCGFHV